MRHPPKAVTRLSLALPPPLADEVRATAAKLGIPVNDAITRALTQWVKTQ